MTDHLDTTPSAQPQPLLQPKPQPPTQNGLPGTAGSPSVSLKIGRTSVMLYLNSYRKPADGTPGCSVQEYLGSFSIHASEIPPAFDALLRQATSGRPERYRALVERLQERVLEPARLRWQTRQRQQQREQLLGLLAFAHQQLEAVDGVPDAVSHLVEAPVRAAVDLVVRRAQCLQVPEPGTDKLPDVADDTVTADGAVAEPVEAKDLDSAEDRLQALLTTINSACSEIASMMPEAARRFRRGHPFEDKTVEQVHRLWFLTSDAIAALNGRGQLKRPKMWEALRATAMNSAHAEAPADRS